MSRPLFKMMIIKLFTFREVSDAEEGRRADKPQGQLQKVPLPRCYAASFKKFDDSYKPSNFLATMSSPGFTLKIGQFGLSSGTHSSLRI